jgi:hypothetical protein
MTVTNIKSQYTTLDLPRNQVVFATDPSKQLEVNPTQEADGFSAEHAFAAKKMNYLINMLSQWQRVAAGAVLGNWTEPAVVNSGENIRGMIFAPVQGVFLVVTATKTYVSDTGRDWVEVGTALGAGVTFELDSLALSNNEDVIVGIGSAGAVALRRWSGDAYTGDWVNVTGAGLLPAHILTAAVPDSSAVLLVGTDNDLTWLGDIESGVWVTKDALPTGDRVKAAFYLAGVGLWCVVTDETVAGYRVYTSPVASAEIWTDITGDLLDTGITLSNPLGVGYNPNSGRLFLTGYDADDSDSPHFFAPMLVYCDGLDGAWFSADIARSKPHLGRPHDAFYVGGDCWVAGGNYAGGSVAGGGLVRTASEEWATPLLVSTDDGDSWSTPDGPENTAEAGFVHIASDGGRIVAANRGSGTMNFLISNTLGGFRPL